MNEKKPYMVGNARLSDLNGFEDVTKNGVRGCFIPYDLNPSIYVGVSKQTGAQTVDLDILVREVQNSKSGSSHFIKLNVGRVNRERFNMSTEALESLKIIGNLFTRIPGQNSQGMNAGAGQGAYQRSAQIPQYGQRAVPQQQMSPSGQVIAPARGGFVPQGQQGGFAPQQPSNDSLPAGW